MAGELDVASGLTEDVHDVIHRGGRPGAGVVPPRNGVGDVGGRRHPMEVGGPLVVGGEAPEGRQYAVHRDILPVPLRTAQRRCR